MPEPMQLQLESGSTILGPSDEEIARVLPLEKFAIISDGPDSSNYLQFVNSARKGLQLEYRSGSEDSHFSATNAGITIEQIILAFQKYGDASWRSDFTWQNWEVIEIRGEKTAVPPEWGARLRNPKS